MQKPPKELAATQNNDYVNEGGLAFKLKKGKAI